MVLLRRDRGATHRKSFRTCWCVALRTCDARFLSHDAVVSFRRSTRSSRPWALDRRLPCRGQVSTRTCVDFPSSSVGKHEATYERREARRGGCVPFPWNRPTWLVRVSFLSRSCIVFVLRQATDRRLLPSTWFRRPSHHTSVPSVPSHRLGSFVRSFSPSSSTFPIDPQEPHPTPMGVSSLRGGRGPETASLETWTSTPPQRPRERERERD